MKKTCIISIFACLAILYSCNDYTDQQHEKEKIAKEATIKKLRNDADGCMGCHGTVGVTDLSISGKEFLIVQRKRDPFLIGEKIFIDSATLERGYAYYVDSNDWESPGRPWSKMNDSASAPSLAAYRDTSLVETIKQGGSLCGTLHVNTLEAKRIAKTFGFRSYYRGRTYIVIVYAGDSFVRKNGQWYRFLPVKSKTSGRYNGGGYGNLD